MKKKIINNIQVMTVCLILVLSFIKINIYNKLNYCLDKKNQYPHKTLELADYSSFIEGEGENINITLHQSLMKTKNIEFGNLDTANTFIEACPSDPSFNSSFTNVTIEDIKAPDKHIIVENDLPWGLQDARQIFVSFEVQGVGYLENISVFMRQTGLGNYNYVDFYILTAEDVNGKLRPLDSSLTKIYDNLNITTSADWYNATDIHYKFNCSNTINNTYFLYSTYSEPGTANWGYNPDIEGDGVNESIVLDSSENPVIIPMIVDNTIDLLLEIDVSPYIYPSSKELIVEDSPWADYEDFSNTIPAATSFQIDSDLYLENVSIYLSNIYAYIGTVRVVLYNSIWNTSNSISIPGGTDHLDYIYLDESNISASFSEGWHTITGLHTFLNNSKTDNNTWFIGLWDIGVLGGDLWWYFTRDISGGVTDGIDETKSYLYSSLNSRWELVIHQPQNNPVDFHLKLGLNYDKNIPKPENIGLKINNNAVIGFSDTYGSGYWSSTEIYSSILGQLEFELSADWWDVSCKITKVQINYTKANLKANSLYKVPGSGQDVLWNVSRISGINFFDTRLSNYRINFTIPSHWDNVNVFNGGTNKTEDISLNSGKNGYVIVKVSNAGNGTHWYLTAISNNMLEFIETYIDSTLTNVANYTNLVHFNATFKEELAENNGIIKLNVYSPAKISNKLNFSSSNSTFDSGSEFYLGKWDLSDTVIEYGEFRVQVLWNNDTAAGFMEKILTITGQTDLTLATPDQGVTYYSNQSFNVIVYYKDSNQLKAIESATVQYNINGQGWESTNANNGTIGYYIIPVNCSIFTINGTKTVEITASKNYYESQTLNYNFNVIIVEEKGKQAGEFPLAIIIITITSIVGGIGVAAATLLILRKRKRLTINV